VTSISHTWAPRNGQTNGMHADDPRYLSSHIAISPYHHITISPCRHIDDITFLCPNMQVGGADSLSRNPGVQKAKMDAVITQQVYETVSTTAAELSTTHP
jgi:hypothetical protein